ncbi:MAG: hypothetical protein KDB00_19050 [Planctomycetales bacterium]|nr:hypothetical protein [Planctomycetales bacterium]
MIEKTDRDSLLKDEYLHIQSVIESFDGRMLTIKAWSVSFSLAALGGAFAAHVAEVLLIASLSAFMFWLIEGFWKTFQYAHYNRSVKIEEYFAGTGEDLVPMQIGSSWLVQWKRGGRARLVRIMTWPHVYLPHGAVFALGILLYCLCVIGLITV